MIIIKTRPDLKKSFFYGQHNKKKSGIALILAVGALAAITVITLGFSFNMQAQYKTSLNYLNALKARYLAESGVERAVADLKEDAKERFTYEKDNLNTISNEWDTNAAMTNAALASGTYSVTVEDEQSKINININMASQKLLQNIGFSIQQASDIIAYTTANGPFNFIEELKKVSSIDETVYNSTAGYLTVSSYRDPNSSGRFPVNVNTAEDKVLQSVLKDLSDGTVTITGDDVELLKTSIKNRRPISSWNRFNEAVDAALSDVAKREIVKNNCNPNRDKSALASATTEFCFFSGGCYTINSTGTIGNYTSRIKAIVKIYETINESTAANFSYGTFTKATYSDSLATWTIPNSLNIGYHDDFGSNNEWLLSGGADISSGELIIPSGGIAWLNKTGRYTVTTGDWISVNVITPPAGVSSGVLSEALPYQVYYTGGPPPQSIEASITAGNNLKLYSVDCTAKLDNLRILNKTGSYVTRAYTVPTGAEKPAYAVPYGTVTMTDPGDGSDVSLSFASTGPDTIQVEADFSNPNLASTAAVLEDIWFICLPKAKFLYRQEG